MATANPTAVTSVFPPAGAQSSGRNEDVWGRRRIGLYRVQGPSSSGASGIVFDPVAHGFQGPVAAVFLSTRIPASGNRYEARAYDYANKVIRVWDLTDGDEPAGDDQSALYIDVLVVGE